MPNTRSVDTVKTSPAANPSVMLRFDFGPSQEIAPLHAVHLATCDLAEHALNGSFTIGLSTEHVHPQAGVWATDFTPGSPDAPRNVTE